MQIGQFALKKMGKKISDIEKKARIWGKKNRQNLSSAFCIFSKLRIENMSKYVFGPDVDQKN